MENKPAVEFTPQSEEDTSEPTWWVLGGIGLITGGLAVVAAVPGFWEDQVVGNTSRRGRGLSEFLEFVGFVPTVSVLGGVAVICLLIAVVSFLRSTHNERKE